MRFHLTRFAVALSRRLRRLWLVPLAMAVSLAVQAALPYGYTISQTVLLSPLTPLAATRSPVRTVAAGELPNDPGYLFLQEYALMDLKEGLFGDDRAPDDSWLEMTAARQFNQLRRVVGENMRLFAVEDGAGLRVDYAGPDRHLGEWIVRFYARRLLDFAANGREIAARYGARVEPGANGPGFGPSAGLRAQAPLKAREDLAGLPPASLAGEPAVEVRRRLFSPDRLPAALWTGLAALAVLLLSVAANEYTGDRLLSERHAARHLGLPLWGVMPDLEGLDGRLGRSMDPERPERT